MGRIVRLREKYTMIIPTPLSELTIAIQRSDLAAFYSSIHQVTVKMQHTAFVISDLAEIGL